MEPAFVEEQEARRARREARSEQAAGKQLIEAEGSADGAKRAKLELQSGSGQGRGAEIDVTSIPVEAVIELVLAGLSAVPLDHLRYAFDVSGTIRIPAYGRMLDVRWLRIRRTQYRYLQPLFEWRGRR